MFTVDRKVTTDRQINSFKILLNEPGYLLEFIKGIWLRFCFVFFWKQVWLEVICKSRKKIHQQTKTKANWSMDKTQENCISQYDRQATLSITFSSANVTAYVILEVGLVDPVCFRSPVRYANVTSWVLRSFPRGGTI